MNIYLNTFETISELRTGPTGMSSGRGSSK